MRANNAKTNLIQEIMSFNTEREQAEGALEDHKDEAEQQAIHFTVRDPVKVGKIMKYTVTGRDQQGEWTCQRRFNEFEALQRVLTERWPGCYIPAIPEKIAYTVDVQNMKMADNNDAEFVEGRRVLLEKFIRQCSHFEYILGSVEFGIFARGAGEVTAQLDAMEALRPIEILEKFRLNFSIDEEQANQQMLVYKEKISSFEMFLTKTHAMLEVRAPCSTRQTRGSPYRDYFRSAAVSGQTRASFNPFCDLYLYFFRNKSSNSVSSPPTMTPSTSTTRRFTSTCWRSRIWPSTLSVMATAQSACSLILSRRSFRLRSMRTLTSGVTPSRMRI